VGPVLELTDEQWDDTFAVNAKGVFLCSQEAGKVMVELGGWMSVKVFDLTGSYHAAFVNGIAWNLLNMAIAATLLVRTVRHRPALRV